MRIKHKTAMFAYLLQLITFATGFRTLDSPDIGHIYAGVALLIGALVCATWQVVNENTYEA